MEQAFACPHCGQTLAAPASMAGFEVQCPYCSGRSTVPSFAAPSAAPAAVTDNEYDSPPPLPTESSGNQKLIVAGCAILAFACVPVLIFAMVGKTSNSAGLVAAKSPAVANRQAPALVGGNLSAQTSRSAAAPATRSEAGNKAPIIQREAPSAAAIALRPATASQGAEAKQPAVPSLADPKGQRTSTTELVEQVEPSVIIVDTGDGLGSGFVYDQQGTIITNYHVIEGAKQAEIKFADKTSAPVTGFLAISPGKDLAILRFNLGGRRLKPLAVAPSRPSKGESVLAFGAPRGLGSTVSDGIVSAVREGTELRDTFKSMTKVDIYVEHLHYDLDAVWIQTTAPISGGNSGGPLVNLRGEVVGLNTWNRTDGQNLNFAISAEHIKKMMQSTQSGVQPLANLPAPREKRVVAGAGDRTLEYWEEVSRINRALAARIKKLRQPPLPTNRKKLLELFPKLAGIYRKLGDMLPETAAKLKHLKIDDVDEELVALVAVDAIYLEKLAESFRSMAVDAKMMQDVTLVDANKLGTKSYGEYEKVDLSAAYDIMRIKLTNRYGLTFASILSDGARGKSDAKSDDKPAAEDEKPSDAEEGNAVDSAREKQAAGKLKLAKSLKSAGKLDAARQRLEQIVKDYPGTEAAKEAAELLKEFEE